MISRTGFAALFAPDAPDEVDTRPDADRLPERVAYPLIGFLACLAWALIAWAILAFAGAIR